MLLQVMHSALQFPPIKALASPSSEETSNVLLRIAERAVNRKCVPQ